MNGWWGLCYGQGGQLTPIDLIVEERFHRAAPRGMGGTKAAGNYSPVLCSLTWPCPHDSQRGQYNLTLQMCQLAVQMPLSAL